MALRRTGPGAGANLEAGMRAGASAAGETTRVRARRIEIEIDELILHGFDATDRYLIGDALERELVRLLATEPPLAVAHTATERIDAGKVVVQRGGHRETTGTAVARAIHARLTRPRRSRGGSAARNLDAAADTSVPTPRRERVQP